MEMVIKQISSLHKVRKKDRADYPAIMRKLALPGESFSYQVYIRGNDPRFAHISVDSPLREHVRVYRVVDAVMDTPVVVETPQEDYITHEPGLMPDILIPVGNQGVYLDKEPCVFWVRVDVPADVKPGDYQINIRLSFVKQGGEQAENSCQTLELQVIPAVMPEQKLIYTRWMYLDCIATAHNVEIFSPQHWDLIEQYIAAASDVGINMMMVPVHTPPLDTEVGTARPCVQLVDIEKNGEAYSFGFERFHRYIALCKKHGIQYFEIAHMFSQWGAKFTPNIMVSENGQKSYLFGWHVPAQDPSYASFLKQYISAIAAELEKAGISENTYFHISDEPSMETMESYQAAAELIRPLIGKSKTFDALSNFEFFEKGLVECPVTIVDRLHEFLRHDVDNQWAYYCCGPTTVYPNAFMAMPSYRVRILGFLLYRYEIKGFLHWGFNFYNACRSVYTIDPYVTTSGDGAYPSGDPFIVYPGNHCVYPSVRGELTYEAIQDMNVCFALEQRIGREAVVKLIDDAAGGELRFDAYPKNAEYIDDLRQAMLQKLKEELL